MSIYGDSGLGDVAKSIELKLMHFVETVFFHNSLMYRKADLKHILNVFLVTSISLKNKIKNLTDHKLLYV